MALPRLAPLALATCLAAPLAAQTVFVDQGRDWTNSLRTQFYTQDQGARIMPISWMRALDLPDGQAFLHDALDRYGYLPLPDAGEPDLPVGFTTNGSGAQMAVGMTCAACHTREIDVNGTAYRLDGGPGIVDFQSFLKDLDDAVLAVLASDAAFNAFAAKVLGDNPSQADTDTLKTELTTWSNRFHTLIERSLPDPAWGPSRLDAVSMIFNRLAGLDLGPEEDDFIIAENIAVADAPTRYPFLWNAARQDYTQWPGFSKNGNAFFGLTRNLGEVYGVFAEFHPEKTDGILSGHDYITRNSANWDGLKDLEDWIWDIGAPRWPWDLNQTLADQGEEIFNLSTDNGGCVECHGIKTGEFRSLRHRTWATPILDAGTDTRECQILTRTVKTGVLSTALNPLTFSELGEEAPAFDVLGTAVIWAIAQHSVDTLFSAELVADARAAAATPDTSDDRKVLERLGDIEGAFPMSGSDNAPRLTAATPECKYESRVLEGIWAAAPYLHNGSVPTLADLLETPDNRPASFVPGPAYDIDKVGMAADQTKFDHVIETTGCDDLASGNSRCGHDYGTDLDADQKTALLEYLKSL